MGEQVLIVGPNDLFGRVPKGELGNIPPGYRVANDEDRARFEKIEKYGGTGHSVLAAVSGLASGATAGVTDLAALGFGKLVGAEDEISEALNAYRDFSPVLHTGGEIIGTVIGAGKALKAVKLGAKASLALRAGTAPMRGLMAAGDMAAAAASKLPMAEKLAIPMIARGVAEGALFGGSHAITENALGRNPDLVGELLSSSLHGAIAGGGLAAGLALTAKGLGLAASKAGGLVRKHIAEVDEVAIGNLGERVTGVRPTGVTKKAAEMLAEGWATIRGVPSGGLKKLVTSPAARHEAANYERISQEGISTLHAEVEKVRKIREAFSDEMIGPLKAKQIDLKIKRGNEAEVYWRTAAELRQLRQELVAASRDAGRFDKRGKLNDLAKQVRATLEDLGLEIKEGQGLLSVLDAVRKPLDNTKVFMALDVLNRDIGKLATEMGRGRARPPSRLAATMDLLTNWYGRTSRFQGNEAVFGEASVLHKTVNIPWHTSIDSDKYHQINKHFMTSSETDWGKKLWRFDKQKIESAMNGLTNPEQSESIVGLNEYLRTTKDFVETVAKSAELSPAHKKLVAELGEAVAASQKAVGDVSSAAMNKNHLKMLTGGATSGITAGLIGGSMMLGAPYGLAGLLATPLVNPHLAISQLAAVESLASGIQRRLSGKVGPWMRKKAEGIVRAGTVAELHSDDPVEQYNARAADLRQLALDKPRLEASIRNTLDDVAIKAPRVTEAAVRSAVGKVDYLSKKLPVQETAGPWASQPYVSQTEAEDFNDLALAVASPETLMDDLHRGTLSKKKVDGVRETSPTIFADFAQAAVQEQLDLWAAGKEIPFEDKMQLSILLGVQTDPMQDPRMVARIQASYASPQAQPRATPVDGRVSKKAVQMQTASSRMASDEQEA